jgi:hypothetical protein
LLLVQVGGSIDAGDALTDGDPVPADILRIKGEDALYVYMLDEVQNANRARGAALCDTHIEVILRQMLSKVRVLDAGDTHLIPNEVVDKFLFRDANDELARKLRIEDAGGTLLQVGSLVDKAEIRAANELEEARGKYPCQTTKPRPATARTLLLGITKASLQAESFLARASFQDTAKVLTTAALASEVDRLVGLKENVLLGHAIPAGTGFAAYSKAKVKRLVEMPEYEDADLGTSLDDLVTNDDGLDDGLGEWVPSIDDPNPVKPRPVNITTEQDVIGETSLNHDPKGESKIPQQITQPPRPDIINPTRTEAVTERPSDAVVPPPRSHAVDSTSDARGEDLLSSRHVHEATDASTENSVDDRARALISLLENAGYVALTSQPDHPIQILDEATNLTVTVSTLPDDWIEFACPVATLRVCPYQAMLQLMTSLNEKHWAKFTISPANVVQMKHSLSWTPSMPASNLTRALRKFIGLHGVVCTNPEWPELRNR